MAITEVDLELYARRVRPHFPGELRDAAQALALAIARYAGASTKLLRPQTTFAEILAWMGVESFEPRTPGRGDSLDVVEAVMALQEEAACEFAEALLSKPAATTFLDLVRSVAEQHAKTERW